MFMRSRKRHNHRSQTNRSYSFVVFVCGYFVSFLFDAFVVLVVVVF